MKPYFCLLIPEIAEQPAATLKKFQTAGKDTTKVLFLCCEK